MDKDDMIQYGFYNDSNQYTVVLNVENIKKFLGAEIILLEETEHK